MKMGQTSLSTTIMFKVLILKNRDKFLIVIFTIFFNLSIYILNFINYDSTKGTDYNLYGKYLENFIFNYTQNKHKGLDISG